MYFCYWHLIHREFNTQPDCCCVKSLDKFVTSRRLCSKQYNLVPSESCDVGTWHTDLMMNLTNQFHDVVTASLIVGHSLMSAWWPGTLSDNLHDPTLSDDKCKAALKTHFFSKYQNIWCIRGILVTVLYKCTITYLLTVRGLDAVWLRAAEMLSCGTFPFRLCTRCYTCCIIYGLRLKNWNMSELWYGLTIIVHELSEHMSAHNVFELWPLVIMLIES